MKEAYIIQEADRVPFVLTENVDVGDILRFGDDMVAVAGTSGLAGETITVYVGGVVVQAPAATDKAINVGDKLYWDHVNRVLTTDANDGGSTNYNPAGHAVSAKASGVAGSVQFLLNR